MFRLKTYFKFFTPVISQNVVIGEYTIILGRATVGESSIIKAGSHVFEDIPANTIYYNQYIKKLKVNNKPIENY